MSTINSASSSAEVVLCEMGEFNVQQVRYFRKLFNLFDVDRSGSISFVEMKSLAQHLGVSISDDALRASIQRIDENGNGALEFNEVLAWLNDVNQIDGADEFTILKAKLRAQGTAPLTSSQLKHLRILFDNFDLNGSGTIDAEELRAVFHAMGHEEMNDKDFAELWEQADVDKSGEIDFDEFLLVMCSSFTSASVDDIILQEFRRHDSLSTGFISTADAEVAIMELVGEGGLDKEEVREMAHLGQLLQKGDGFIEYMKWHTVWDACRSL